MSDMGYQEFLDGVLLFRGLRDMDDFPETWTERWLSGIVISDDPKETKDFLRLATKVAELIDDRQAALLKDIEDDIYQINFPGGQPAEIEIVNHGQSNDWWFDQDLVDDYGCRFSIGIYGSDGEIERVRLNANITADDKETANHILRERVEQFLVELPAAA